MSLFFYYNVPKVMLFLFVFSFLLFSLSYSLLSQCHFSLSPSLSPLFFLSFVSSLLLKVTFTFYNPFSHVLIWQTTNTRLCISLPKTEPKTELGRCFVPGCNAPKCGNTFLSLIYQTSEHVFLWPVLKASDISK